MQPTVSIHTFGKNERLCSKMLIDKLFLSGQTLVVKQIKAISLKVIGEKDTGIKVLFAVPRKNFKRAVDRNRIKRLMREAYRTQKRILTRSLKSEQQILLLALVYMGKNIPEFQEVKEIIFLILQRLSEKYEETGHGDNDRID